MSSPLLSAAPIVRSNAEYLARQSAVESNARSYPRKLPLAVVWARGIEVRDADGRTYLDCLSNAGTLALGHNHPVVVEALQHHLASGMPMQTLDLPTPTKDQFVEELLASLPEKFARHARIQFCGPSGSDAVEAAMKLVKTATGHRAMLAFSGGYHGQTQGSLALMGNLGPKNAVHGLMPDVHFLPYPYPYRMAGHDEADVAARCADHAEQLLYDDERGIPPIAGMILETVQGEGGVIPAPSAWLKRIRHLATQQNIPLIFDEVQTGLGRTGRLYGFEHADVLPDVLVLSKAIGGGLPLAVVVYHEKLDVWKPGAHAGTFRGNQMAMTAGLATLRFIQSEDLPSHAEKMGQFFMHHLQELQHVHSFIGEVRGRGLMLGIEIIDPDRLDPTGRPEAHPALARAIQKNCLAHGLIIELGGRHGAVMRLLPPLIITSEQVTRVCEILATAFALTAQTLSHV
jgi:diaminobutyrate-2-oxoglutarate transaminase